MNTIAPEKDAAIWFLLARGLSFREIQKRTGCTRKTIARRVSEFPEARNKKSGPAQCDYCGELIGGEREFYRRAGRTRHKFCGRPCHGAFRRHGRDDEYCIRCGITPSETKWGIRIGWTRGMCGRCYDVMWNAGFDPKKAELYELTQALKREIANANGNSS